MRRRKGLIAILIAAAVVVLIVLVSSGGNGDKGYVVRAIFDNGGFMVRGEQIRIAGATVGEVEEVDVTRKGEIDSYENGKPQAIPGKAVIVMKITDEGFQDFREDATCQIRPQSLIGEKFVDCRPTMPRAPGTEPPPPLKEIGDGQPGEGEYLLPLENNSSSVDPDLINNIHTLPYAQRFRLIFNELGATLAGRGSDIEEAVKRANPDLRDADLLLKILGEQSDELAQLASDSDAFLEPLAREKSALAGFISGAGETGEATGEQVAELEASLERFPQFLREFRTTMRELQGFSDAATPVFKDLDVATPALTEATRNLAPFSSAATVALKSLGNAGEAAGPTFRAADPIVKKARNLARTGASPTTKLAKFFVNTSETGGWNGLANLIYNGAAATNEFDRYGHMVKSLVTLTNCLNYVSQEAGECSAKFDSEGASSSSATMEALLQRVQENLARESGGTAATETGPSPFLPPSAPAEPTPELDEGEELDSEAPAPEEEEEPLPGPEGAEEAPRANGGPSPAQRALLDYLLGP